MNRPKMPERYCSSGRLEKSARLSDGISLIVGICPRRESALFCRVIAPLVPLKIDHGGMAGASTKRGSNPGAADASLQKY